MSVSVDFSVAPPNNARLANLCGTMDDNINHIARAFSVRIKRRGGCFQLRGAAAASAAAAIKALYSQADKDIKAADVRRHLARQLTTGVAASPPAVGGAMLRNAAQRVYQEKIFAHSVVMCAGPAGTGKTHVALVAALDLLRARVGGCRRLVLTRPVLEAGGERLGFLPGDMEQKINPYLRPLHDILNQQLGRQEAERRMAGGEIEIIPLAFMRGLTLNNTVVILDEAQNTTPAQMKMFLTRMGDGAKMIITGDVTQNDLPASHASGLSDAIARLRNVGDVAYHRFDEGDIVRHPLVAEILRAYAK